MEKPQTDKLDDEASVFNTFSSPFPVQKTRGRVHLCKFLTTSLFSIGSFSSSSVNCWLSDCSLRGKDTQTHRDTDTYTHTMSSVTFITVMKHSKVGTIIRRKNTHPQLSWSACSSISWASEPQSGERGLWVSEEAGDRGAPSINHWSLRDFLCDKKKRKQEEVVFLSVLV